MSLPDYSSFLTQSQIAVEERAWLEAEIYRRNAEFLMRTTGMGEHSVVLEMGCGIGLVAGEIHARLPRAPYFGVDKNLLCIERAHRRNAENESATFLLDDVRGMRWVRIGRYARPDVVCAFAFLKHFGKDEAPRILARLAAATSAFLVFDVLIAHGKEWVDDGVDFHHSWWPGEALDDTLFAAGLEIVETSTVNELGHGREVLVCARLKE